MRIFLVILFAAATALAQAPAEPLPVFENLREAFNATDAVAFSRDFAPALKEEIAEKFLPYFLRRTKGGWGEWETVREVSWDSGRSSAKAKVQFAETTQMLVLALDAEGRITRFDFSEVDTPDFDHPKSASAPLRFPLKGTWLVLAGGDPETYAAAGRTMQNAFALDLVKVTDGRAWKAGRETRNDQFPAYGQEVAAPIGGKLIQATDSIPENAPGERNAFAPEGNALVIKMADREYLSLSHLKGGSFSVKVGAEVAPGQTLARIGNSGDTPHPVLSMNASTDILGQKGLPIKFAFACVEVQEGQNWEKRENYSPSTGDLLRPCAE
jgi:murein DD-endopeptidase MepM/ murein hydrolase activator NlpD